MGRSLASQVKRPEKKYLQARARNTEARLLLVQLHSYLTRANYDHDPVDQLLAGKIKEWLDERQST